MPVRHRRPKAGERNRGAVDALQTQIAVNLQNLNSENFLQQLRDNIAELPDATGCDAAFLVLFSEDGANLETVLSSSSVFAGCNPNALAGESLSLWPWLSKRLGHLRVIEMANTDRGPKVAAAEYTRLSELGMGSCLIIGFAIRNEIAGFIALANERPLEAWDANLHLLMKLIGSSLASGLERMRSTQQLAELEERKDLVNVIAHDGVWDFDGVSKRIKLSRRWKEMLGYDLDQEDVLLGPVPLHRHHPPVRGERQDVGMEHRLEERDALRLPGAVGAPQPDLAVLLAPNGVGQPAAVPRQCAVAQGRVIESSYDRAGTGVGFEVLDAGPPGAGFILLLDQDAQRLLLPPYDEGHPLGFGLLPDLPLFSGVSFDDANLGRLLPHELRDDPTSRRGRCRQLDFPVELEQAPRQPAVAGGDVHRSDPFLG